jgi:hypothetical protein
MRTVDIVAAVMMTAVLGGFAASGVQVTEQQAQSFRVGKTTYPEIVTALGEPTTVNSSSSGNRVAVYSYSSIASRPQNFIPYVGPLVRWSRATTQSRAP